MVNWCQTGIKCSLHKDIMAKVPNDDMGIGKRSILTMSNTTAIRQAFNRITSEFDKMFKHKAFVHKLNQNEIDEIDLDTAREDLAKLEDDYIDAEKDIDSEEDDYDQEYGME